MLSGSIVINDKGAIKIFFQYLQKQKIVYTLLHGYENPNLGDVDICLNAKTLMLIESLAHKFEISSNFRLIQVFQHEFCAKYLILVKTIDNKVEYLIPDVCSNYVRDNRILLTSEELLKNRIFSDGFYKSAPIAEAEYIFLKRSLKKTWGENHLTDFQKISEIDGEDISKRLKKYLNSTLMRQFKDVTEKGDLEHLNRISPYLRKSILRRTFFSNPLGYFIYTLNNIPRIIKRVLNPTGLVIAIIGTDGSGKSTVIKHMMTTLAPAFRRVKGYHWKPELFERKLSENIIVTEPHKEPPRNTFISLLKLFMYIGQYILGYLFKIQVQKIKSTLIIFDRYYYDIIVDPKRFRMKIPGGVIRFFLHFIPKPDLIFYLQTDAEIALSRKNELTIEEINRQNNEFMSLQSLLKERFYVIDNNNDVDSAVNDITTIIFEFLEKRLFSK